MRPTFEQIIGSQAVDTVFQPIVSLRARAVIAHEALARGPQGTPLQAPLALFAAARASNRLAELELLCFAQALRAARDRRVPGRVFVNVSPDALLAGIDWPTELARLCERHGVEPGRCVLELTEQSLVADYAAIRHTLDALRGLGFDFAIDDFGSGYSGLRMWAELRPDFVKIDRYFVAGVRGDSVRLEFVRSIVDMARAAGSEVIAEGVEHADECRALYELGVDAAQGFLLGAPLERPVADRRPLAALAVLEEIVATAATPTAEALVQAMPAERVGTMIRDFIRRVHAEPDREAFPVVDDGGAPVGIVWRDEFLLRWAKPLHPEILAKKPLATVMDTAPVIVDARLRLEQASRLVIRGAGRRSANWFIITRDGRYAGIGRTVDLLERITQQKLRAAAHSNPLTLLPGAVPFGETLDRLLAQGRDFRVAYLDVDAFKPYNDLYGYVDGDRVLLRIAQILREATSQHLDVVCHVGGDDFVLLLRSANWRARLRRILAEFDAVAPTFYRAEHRAAGGIDAIDRYGVPRRFPFVALSVAVLAPLRHALRSVEDVSSHLQVIKREAKSRPGSCVLYAGCAGLENLTAQWAGEEPESATGQFAVPTADAPHVDASHEAPAYAAEASGAAHEAPRVRQA